MKRFLCLVAALLILGAAGPACAGKVVIDISQFVEHPALDGILKGFQDELKDAGIDAEYNIYNSHGNISVVYQIATQVAADKPDMIVAIATPNAQALVKQYEKTPALKGTPMLFTGITDPLLAGLVTNYERPGGDVTGVSNQMPMGKHLDMLRRFLPDLKRLGFLYNAGEANSVSNLNRIKIAAKERNIEIVETTVTSSADVQQAASSLVGNVDAIYIPTDNTVVSAMEVVVKVGQRSRTPVFVADADSVTRGAIAALGFDYYLHGRQTGAMAIRILNGAKPGDTPVEFQKKLSLHVYPAAAAKMGVTIPDDLIKEADVVHE